MPSFICPQADLKLCGNKIKSSVFDFKDAKQL